MIAQENSGGAGAKVGRRTSILVHQSIMSNPTLPPAPPTPAAATPAPAAASGAGAGSSVQGNTGIVPHLAAHTGELTAIYEVSEFLPDAPHLINVTKKCMITKTLLFLARLQRSVYRLSPVRLVGTVINRSFQPYQYFSAGESSAATTELYNLSLAKEP